MEHQHKNTIPPSPAKQEPAAPKDQSTDTPASDQLDPTRYGDWEKNGRCIDF